MSVKDRIKAAEETRKSKGAHTSPPSPAVSRPLTAWGVGCVFVWIFAELADVAAAAAAGTPKSGASLPMFGMLPLFVYRRVPKCFNIWQKSVCMRSKAWLAASVWLRQARLPPSASRMRRSRRLRDTLAAAPGLLAHASVTGAVNFFLWFQNLCI